MRMEKEAVDAVGLRRWTREEYDRMAEAGVFGPEERVELIDGEVFRIAPQKSPHATAVRLVQEALRVAFGSGYDVRPQLPLALDPYSQPEPDIAVVLGTPRNYRNAHPASAVLVAEIADTTLSHDRERKGSLYARAAVPEYWIVNLVDRWLEVYRDPAPQSQAFYGWHYAAVQHFGVGEVVSTLGAPSARLAVADLLP